MTVAVIIQPKGAFYDQEFIIIYRGEYPTLIYPCRRTYRKVMIQYFRVFPFTFVQFMMSLIGQDIDLIRT